MRQFPIICSISFLNIFLVRKNYKLDQKASTLPIFLEINERKALSFKFCLRLRNDMLT